MAIKEQIDIFILNAGYTLREEGEEMKIN